MHHPCILSMAIGCTLLMNLDTGVIMLPSGAGTTFEISTTISTQMTRPVGKRQRKTKSAYDVVLCASKVKQLPISEINTLLVIRIDNPSTNIFLCLRTNRGRRLLKEETLIYRRTQKSHKSWSLNILIQVRKSPP